MKTKNTTSLSLLLIAISMSCLCLLNINSVSAASDAYTKLLLHADGANGSTTFVDSSSGAKTVTRSGAPVISTTQSKFGGASLNFNGNGFLSTADSSDWDFGGGDFTIDYWVRYPIAIQYNAIVSQWKVNNKSWLIEHFGANAVYFYYSTAGSDQASFTFPWTPSLDTWYHCAFTRSGSSLRFFVNGTQVGSTQNIGSTIFFNSTDPVQIGQQEDNTTTVFNGNIDELRISKGIARWTANFTSPNGPYDTNTATLTTQNLTNITATTATGNGNITDTGGENPTRSTEWGTVSGTYTNSCSAGTGSTGTFSCAMTGLSPNTTYYVRAYATNSSGTAYGTETSFTTTAFVCGTDTIFYGGQAYNTVQIGAQCWFRENLNVGTMLASGSTMPSNDSAIEKWCYNNDTNICNTDGGLYTWAEANGLANSCNTTTCTPSSPNQGICPTGWHIPTHDEYTTLERAVCTSGTCATDFPFDVSTVGQRGTDEGAKLTTFCLNGNNSSGFTGLMAGYRYTGGVFGNRGANLLLWSTSPISTSSAWIRYMGGSGTSKIHRGTDIKTAGFSVRCIKDTPIVISPTVTTNSTSNITSTTATGNANITSTGGENPTRSIEWGTSTGNYSTGSCTAGTGSTGAYSCSMINLTPSTIYYVRAKATNSAGISYGEETSFTTTAFVCGTDTVTRNSITYGTVVGADGNCWLDRNLGATRVATAYNDSQAYGWLFQWGRSDDGHQITASGTTATNATTDNPGNANFITEGTSPYDWRVPQNNNLWQGVSGVNNPCPTGFRLPTQTEWATEVTAAGITNYATAYNSSLKLTAAGGRNSSTAALYNQGSFGYYWSSSPSGADAFYLFLYSGGVDPAYYVYRAYGLSVRCLKDNFIVASTITTQTLTSITSTTATANGNVTATGGANPTRSIEWGTSTGNYSTGSCTAGTGGTGTYSCSMTSLSPNTTYYVRAKATNSAGTSYGDEISFVTLQATAMVTTQAATNIAITTATLNGNITDIGSENSERLIEYGTTSGNYPNSCTANTGGVGAYSCQITSLTPDTTYYYRAKATNSAGTSYGTEQSFQTLPDYITIVDPTPVKMNTAVSSGQVTLNSGTASSTPLVTTNTNIHIQDTVVRMVIPQNTQITNTDSGNFNFQNFIAENAITTVKQTIPNSLSAVKVGVPNTKLTFSQPITLTIDVNPAYNGRTLDVLYQNDGESTWHSQTSCTITAGQCIFQTNHATTYTVNGSGNMVGDTGINLNTDIQEVISLDCGTSIINMGNLTPGTPVTGSSTCLTTTNANGGYNLSVRRDDSTDTTMDKTTEAITNITDKTPWNPTTPNATTWSGTGLGFTVYDSTANKNTTWWGTGNSINDSNNLYAGFSPTQTDIMRHTTYSNLGTTTSIGYKLDVPPAQKSGAYSGSVTYQVVTTP